MKPKTILIVAFLVSIITILGLGFIARSYANAASYCSEGLDEQRPVTPATMIWESLPAPISSSISGCF